MNERTVTLALESAPTSSGVYRTPDGYGLVELCVGDDGSEHWMELGVAGTYTRRQIAERCHGPESWWPMYTAAELADEIRVVAHREGMSIEDVVEHVAGTGRLPASSRDAPPLGGHHDEHR
ncbi:hypothetical protein ABRP18_003810 [Microbacterium sp. WHRI 7836]|uniref:hypothetical protein n=1 Tax=Microbacterium sp. WHRI 7836 TaxID=3162563 RepID=UPI0032EE61C8